jgi:predicted outer membrane lipoprotein
VHLKEQIASRKCRPALACDFGVVRAAFFRHGGCHLELVSCPSVHKATLGYVRHYRLQAASQFHPPLACHFGVWKAVLKLGGCHLELVSCPRSILRWPLARCLANISPFRSTWSAARTGMPTHSGNTPYSPPHSWSCRCNQCNFR